MPDCSVKLQKLPRREIRAKLNAAIETFMGEVVTLDAGIIVIYGLDKFELMRVKGLCKEDRLAWLAEAAVWAAKPTILDTDKTQH